MRKLLILLVLIGCKSRPVEKAKDNDFAFLQLRQLPTLATPLTFNSDEDVTSPIDNRTHDSLISEIETKIQNYNVFGKVFETPQDIAIIGVVPAEATTN